ncbi:MAG: hypothetical protein M3Y82_14255, partial [Verrucomicrobiota bacterium]|nr:hypothetical protein [Verrucomicrobiota bacterium]
MWRFFLCSIIFLSAAAFPAQAHDPGLSTLKLKLAPLQLDATLTFSLADILGLVPLDKNSDGTVSPEEFSQARPLLENIARKILEVDFDHRRIAATNLQIQ